MLVFIVLHYPWWILSLHCSTDFLLSLYFVRFHKHFYSNKFWFIISDFLIDNFFPLNFIFSLSFLNNFMFFFNFSLQITFPYNKRNRFSTVIKIQISPCWRTNQLCLSAWCEIKETRLWVKITFDTYKPLFSSPPSPRT